MASNSRLKRQRWGQDPSLVNKTKHIQCYKYKVDVSFTSCKSGKSYRREKSQGTWTWK